jgi:archaellum component FlaF (FlaF/FlaG flagellin family)
MDFNIIKIAAFIVLLLVYLSVRRFFKNVANYTEKLGQSFDEHKITEETNRSNNINSSKEQL